MCEFFITIFIPSGPISPVSDSSPAKLTKIDMSNFSTANSDLPLISLRGMPDSDDVDLLVRKNSKHNSAFSPLRYDTLFESLNPTKTSRLTASAKHPHLPREKMGAASWFLTAICCTWWMLDAQERV